MKILSYVFVVIGALGSAVFFLFVPGSNESKTNAIFFALERFRIELTILVGVLAVALGFWSARLWLSLRARDVLFSTGGNRNALGMATLVGCWAVAAACVSFLLYSIATVGLDAAKWRYRYLRDFQQNDFSGRMVATAVQHESALRVADAVRAYERFLSDFPRSALSDEVGTRAKKLKKRLEFVAQIVMRAEELEKSRGRNRDSYFMYLIALWLAPDQAAARQRIVEYLRWIEMGVGDIEIADKACRASAADRFEVKYSFAAIVDDDHHLPGSQGSGQTSYSVMCRLLSSSSEDGIGSILEERWRIAEAKKLLSRRRLTSQD